MENGFPEPAYPSEERTRGISGTAVVLAADQSNHRPVELSFRLLFESAPDAMALVDGQGLIVLVNVQTEQLFGYSREELIGERVEKLIPERFRAAHVGHLSSYSVKPVSLPMGIGRELCGLKKDGSEFPVEISLSPLETEDGMLVLAGIRDVSERKHIEELKQLKQRLEQENIYLREEISLEHDHSTVIGQSAAIREVLKKVEQVAPTDSVVLILGETGTGKELIARTIHDLSGRRDRSMVKVNCAALPATLFESELFGREKGAYTGALSREIGRFELADSSTIFLDEIGDIPLESQAKLLRVLQDGEFERLGSPRTIRVNARVIAATNRDLRVAVKDGKFRDDLFYRLSVFPIHIPPLRERREDIPALVWHVLKDLCQRMGRNVESIHPTTLKSFQEYSWPGNVRELRNVIERNLIVNPGPMFCAEVLEPDESLLHAGGKLEDVERRHVQEALQATHWRIRGKGGAAELLGLKPTTLEARMKKLGIVRPHVSDN